MKIILVFCETDELFGEYRAGVFSIFESNPPLGLGAIGTIALEYSCAVKIYDQLLLKKSRDQLIKEILNDKPDMVGFMCTSLNIANSVFCARTIKAESAACVFAGGIHISLCAEKVLVKNVFDFLISGEGEEIFSEILRELRNGQMIRDLKLRGLWLRDSDKNCGMAILKDINQPVINREILNISKYKNRGALLKETPCYSLFSSRGCSYGCKFCSKPQYFKMYRQRKIDLVIEEIKYLITSFGAKAVSFREDNFTIDLGRLENFCREMIKVFDGKFFWECESRATLPYQTLELMYKAGCRGIWCGVETTVPRWQNWINKGLATSTIVKFYDDCKAIGIATGALFMFGFPEQTEDELNADIKFAIELPTTFSAFQCLAIFPGSMLKNYYQENPELCAQINDEIALALTRGKSAQDMIALEQKINRTIRSNRLSYVK